ncbi:uncharacterized protein [Solanum tuberosum]|uniref:uncharacterized protein n=1 Tax=Solanum tuberosum TaxID=4113 RepID=UPI000739F9A6|nr:PREDICTED: uncharacterized protein LOC107058267 [Solanum tuberosum]
MGNFNSILHVEDKIVGSQVQETELRDFKQCLLDTRLPELKTVSRNYTWTNGHTYSSIDKALVNAMWLQSWTHLECSILDPRFSDHSHLCVTIEARENTGPKPFRFFNYLAEHPEFMQTVENNWKSQRQASSKNENRQVHNHITRLTDAAGIVMQDVKGIQEERVSFYRGLLGTKAKQLTPVQPHIIELGPTLNREQQLLLIDKVTTKDVYNALLTIQDNKAPGDPSQAVFVPGRVIMDNILLSDELVKGYGRKGISPRSMMKIVMQKAYDYFEWPFVEQILRLLNFPTKFINWIMACLTTVSHLILSNGVPASPFKAKKGLRGDARSVQLLFDTFQEFSKASGLIVNTSKRSIYFRGVSITEQDEIMAYTGFSRGKMPFRYLGVPLSTKRLSIAQCEPLLEKILCWISSLTTKFLSYVGRAQLIRSVLISMQTYWSQIFILPKKISQLIDQMCKRFLWTGKAEVTKKALVAWSRLCQPQSAGGMNMIDMEIWNKVAISKLLRNMCTKKNKIWIKWIYAYYVKGRCTWEIEPKKAS